MQTYLIKNYGQETLGVLAKLTKAEASVVEKVCNLLESVDAYPDTPELEIRKVTKTDAVSTHICPECKARGVVYCGYNENEVLIFSHVCPHCGLEIYCEYVDIDGDCEEEDEEEKEICPACIEQDKDEFSDLDDLDDIETFNIEGDADLLYQGKLYKGIHTIVNMPECYCFYYSDRIADHEVALEKDAEFTLFLSGNKVDLSVLF